VTRTRILLLLVLALVAEAIAVRVGATTDVIPKLAGTTAWTTSRAAGVIAFVALTLDVMFGLFSSTGLLDRWIPKGASIDVHRWLSGVALSLVGVHVGALLLDSWIRFDALDVLVPGLTSYRTGAIALGIVALHGSLLVHASFGWRKVIGVRAWRALHMLAFAVFVGAVVHGLALGNELLGLYTVAATSVGALLVARIALSIQRRRPTTSSEPRPRVLA
jgi:sulfoxide reductase heme-binding subunit YedZ